MIFYFSGAGNSRNAADIVSKRISEPMIDIAQCLADGQLKFTIGPDEALGIVCAVHFFGLPEIVDRFLREVEFIGTPAYSFALLTFGTLSGSASAIIKRLLRQKGITLDARYSVRMVDTWTPMFNLSDTAATAKRTIKAQPRIHNIADKIASRQQGNHDCARVPYFIGKAYYSTYPRQRETHHFHLAEGRCISCNRCARHCPVGAITMTDGQPVWTSPQCTLCLRCLHNCPTFAIQYGKKTERHGQFVNKLGTEAHSKNK